MNSSARINALGDTGIEVSHLGLGTVKLGRSSGVKYPTRVVIPDDRAARALLDGARDLGINLIDTAPAYGSSEARLGSLLQQDRDRWILCTKVGEEFDGERSSFDFTPEAARASVRRSCERLQTDRIDIVLIHSDGRDREILERMGTLDALREEKAAGRVRAVGISHKEADGARAAIDAGVDVMMATLNPDHQEEADLIAEASALGIGVLIKKALSSGHGSSSDLGWVAEQPGVHSIVVGTTNLDHLRDNLTASLSRP